MLIPMAAAGLKSNAAAVAALIGTSSGYIGYGTADLVVTAPAGSASGDTFYVFHGKRVAAADELTIPGDWSVVATNPTPTRGKLYEFVHDGSASYALPRAAYTDPQFYICAATTAGSAVNGTPAYQDEYNREIKLNSVTPTADSLLLGFVTSGAAWDNWALSGWTQQETQETGDVDMGLYTQDATQASGVASTQAVSSGFPGFKTSQTIVVAIA